MHPVQLHRLSGRLREQARSHSLIAECQVDRRRLAGRHRRQASSHIFDRGLSGHHRERAPSHIGTRCSQDH